MIYRIHITDALQTFGWGNKKTNTKINVAQKIVLAPLVAETWLPCRRRPKV